ncbi:MAG TPA: hypothetical protein VFO38_05235 [Candidatus Saccharimonadales bacterium]|nr:hypothetical protein [Candidatus Saccharimonadales bacterium]
MALLLLLCLFSHLLHKKHRARALLAQKSLAVILLAHLRATPSSPSEQTPTEEQKKQEEQKTPEQSNNSQTGTPSTGGGQPSSDGNNGGTTPPPSPPPLTPPPSGIQSCPAYPAFPDENCTGVPAGVTLSAVSNLTTSADGQTITGLSINGDLVLDHNNVTVTNSRIKGRVVPNGHSGLTLRDVDIGGDSCPSSTNGGTRLVAGNDFTLTRVHAHHNGADFIALSGGGAITIQDSLLNNTCFYDGDHLDAVQYYDPGGVINVTLIHNKIDARPVNGGDYGNAAIFIADFPGSGSQFNIYNNFLAGGNYTLYALDAFSGSGVIIDVAGNKFLRDQYRYGPCALSNSDAFDGTSGIKWTNNSYSDGAAIAITDC